MKLLPTSLFAGILCFLFGSFTPASSGPAHASLPDTLQDVIIYPVLENGHSREFVNQYLYAYAMGNEHLSFRMHDEAREIYSIIIAEFPDEHPDDRRYMLSDSSFLTLEAGFIPGDTIWIQ